MKNYLACGLLLISLTGCGGGSQKSVGDAPDKASELIDVGTMLQLAAAGNAPTGLNNLAQFQGTFPVAYAGIKTGDIVVQWGVKMPGEGAMASAPADIVAYEKKTATEGGTVLYLNGKTAKLSADQFKSAKMAK